MSVTNIVTIGLGGTLLTAGLMYIFPRLSNIDITEYLKKKVEDANIDKLDTLNKKEQDVITNLSKSEQLSVEKQEKIKAITESAAKKIQQVIETKNLSEINKSIDDDWGEM